MNVFYVIICVFLSEFAVFPPAGRNLKANGQQPISLLSIFAL